MATNFSEEATFVGRIARILRNIAHLDVEVINGGVNGYGTSNELSFYHYLWSLR